MSTKKPKRVSGHIGTPKNIANMRMVAGIRHTSCSFFHDRNGNPISNAEVIREVDEGWRKFWQRRGGIPQGRFKGGLQ